MPLYLADTSIWGWANSRERPDLKEKLAERVARDEVATCTPVVLEALHRARTGLEYDMLFGTFFAPLRWLPLGADVPDRAIEVQRGLAHGKHGNHLRPAIDYLIAGIAEAAGPEVVAWFFDRDLRIICEHTGQPYEAERSRPLD